MAAQNIIESETKNGCIAATVAILGDKWTPLLINALSEGTLRFCRLQDAVGGVNPRTLSSRLSMLETQGIVNKIVFPEIPPHTEYSLTDKGLGLLPILKCMADWSAKFPAEGECKSVVPENESEKPGVSPRLSKLVLSETAAFGI